MTTERRSSPRPAVRDFTELFRKVTWDGHRAQDELQFGNDVRQIKRGVYVHVFENPHPHPVHDRNGERRAKGKLLIQSHGATIKFGKFEGGLIARRSQDVEHMHRRDPELVGQGIKVFPSHPGTFAECLRLALVLDLTSRSTPLVVRAAEKHLRSKVRGFLQDAGVAVHNHRGDYRLLTAAPADLVSRVNQWARSEFGEITRMLRKL